MDKLPFELDRYFNYTAGAFEVDMDKLVAKRARHDGIEGVRIHMVRNYHSGGLQRRDPIALSLRADGLYDIEDGNSTYAVAHESAWPRIVAVLVAA